MICDYISTQFEASEYRLNDESFGKLEMELGPFSIDWFASSWSRRTSRYAAGSVMTAQRWCMHSVASGRITVSFTHP